MDRQRKNILLMGGLVVLLVFGLSTLAFVEESSSINLGTGNAALISLEGSIKSGESSAFSSSGINPSKVRELNSKAEKRGADAIIYEINSGGGAVVASKEVMREIESVDVPTICRFRDVAASGAYLFSLGCDRIVADSASLTGSIGVRSSYLEFSGLMDELGITYVNITAGERKDLASPYRNATEEDREVLREKADIIHDEFLTEVREERNLSEEQFGTVRTGEVFLGTEAQELGLVDDLGGRRTALETGENLTGQELKIQEIEQKKPFRLFDLFSIEILEDQSYLQADLRS